MRNALQVLVSVVDQATGPLKKILGGVEDIQDAGSRLQSVGMAMAGVGAGMTALGAPVMAAGAGILSTAGNFEAAMNRVRALTDATGEDFDNLESLARELGATTQYTAAQSAEAMQYLSMASFNTQEIMEGLPETLNLAAAGSLDLAETADIASNIMSGMSLDVSQLGHVSDVLAETSRKTNVNVQMLGHTFSYVGPYAAAAGQSFETMAAAAGILGNVGIQASRSGTALTAGINRLIKPSAEAQEALDRLGVSVYNSEGGFRDLGEILSDMVGRDGMSELTENILDANGALKDYDTLLAEAGESSATLRDVTTIFGAEAAAAFLALMKSLEEDDPLKNLLGLTEHLEENVDGVSRTMAETNMEGFNGQLKELQSAFEGLQLAVGDTGLLDVATKFLEILTDLTSKVSDADKNVLSFTVAIVGLGSALLVTGGALLMFAGGLAASVGALTTAFGAGGALAFAVPFLKGLASVLAGVSGGLAAIVVGAFLLPAAFIKVLAHLQGVELTWGEIFGTMRANLGDFVYNVSQLPEAIGGALEAMKNVTMLRLNSWVSIAREKAQEFITKITDRLSQLPGAIGGALAAAKNIIMLRLSEWVSGAREKAQEFITKIIDGVRSRISEVVSAVTSLKDRALGALAGWASSAYNRGVEFVNSIASGIRNAIGGLRSAVDEAAGVAAGAWPQSPPKWGPLSNIMDYGGNIMTSIASGITPAPLASAMRQALIPTQQQLTSGGGTAGTTAGGGTTSINFAPTINAAPGTDIAAIESVLRDQLEILLERIDRDKNRVSYG